MAWSWYSGKACYLGTSGGEILLQVDVFTPGELYVMKFTVSGQSKGKLRASSLSGTHIYTEDGTYVVYGTASIADLQFIADLDDSDEIFDGCIDSIEVYNFSQLEEFATSPCLQVQDDAGCLMLIEATNETDALGFNFDDLTLSLRLDAKFAKVEYKTDMEASVDSEGNKSIIYFDGNRIRSLLVQAAPTYIHDFLYMCMAIDGFSINGVDYVMQNEEYPSIKWNTRFLEGTVEIPIRKKIAKLNKTNCG